LSQLGIFGNATIMSQSLQLMLQGVIGVYWTVQTCLLFITIVAILPLCLMKNISALAPFSTLGMAAVLTALGAMTIRYLDGSYQAPDGVFYKDLSQDKAPSFGTRNHFFSTESLPFVCMVYTSFDMHYNSPRYYGELRDASIDRFRFAVSVSFTAGSILLFSIAVVGFLTFGGNSDSFILNSYSPRDPLATLCRIAIGLCSLIAYPLNFLGIRNNCLDIFGLAHKIDTRTKFNAFTILLLSILTLISCFATDLGLINPIGGGTTVTLVDFVFPALMYRAIIRKNRGSVMRERIEAWIAMGIMVIGVMLGLIGVWDAIVKAVSAQRHQGVSSPS
jgi:amino acid permease